MILCFRIAEKDVRFSADLPLLLTQTVYCLAYLYLCPPPPMYTQAQQKVFMCIPAHSQPE